MLAARLLARRRRHRLHARRRPQLARARYGFACNRVSAIELVTADGEPRTVDADNDPDLFWALRGGGGGYAIVTALHVDLLPIAELYAGALVFPAELGADAVRAYRDWAATVPDEVTSIVRFLRPPPIPDVPEPLRGRPLLTIDAACIGSQEEGEATIAPLRELGEPIMDTFGQIPAAGLSGSTWTPSSPVPGPRPPRACSRSCPTRRSTPSSAPRARTPGSPLLLAELRHARRRARPRRPRTAAPSRKLDADFVDVRRRHADDARSWARRSTATSTISTRRCSPGPARAATSTSPSAPATSTRSCRRRPAPACARSSGSWDPDGMILANHALALDPA